MQIVLNVDTCSLGATVEDVFKTLTPEQRADIARQVVLDVLTKPNDFERTLAEEQAIAHLIQQFKDDRYNRIETEAQARNSYKFTEVMRQFKSSRDRMLAMIVDESLALYKAEIKALVAADPNTQDALKTVLSAVVEAFPSIVQGAMVSFMAQQLGSVGTVIQNSCDLNSRLNVLQETIQSTLRNNGINI